MKINKLKSMKILMLFYSIILLVVSTYAWMNYPDIITGRTAGLIYVEEDGNILQITNINLDATLYIKNNKTGEFVEANNLNSLLNDIVPHESVNFRIDLDNNTDSNIMFDLILYKMRTNNPKMFEYLSIGLSDVSYYQGDILVPVDNTPSLFCDSLNQISPSSDGTYSYTAIDAVPLPGNSKCVLDLYFYFDKEATLEETQNSYIDMDKIVLAI